MHNTIWLDFKILKLKCVEDILSNFEQLMFFSFNALSFALFLSFVLFLHRINWGICQPSREAKIPTEHWFLVYFYTFYQNENDYNCLHNQGRHINFQPCQAKSKVRVNSRATQSRWAFLFVHQTLVLDLRKDLSEIPTIFVINYKS